MEYSIGEGLFARLLVKRNRCQSETLLLGPIKDVLIQSFQLLRVQLLLECHLCVQFVIVSQRLIQEMIHRISSNLLILPLQIFPPLFLIKIDSIDNPLQVFAHVATQNLLLRLDAAVADQLLL